MQYSFFIIGVIVSIALLFINYTYALGVLVSLMSLFALTFLRKFFYKKLIDLETFNSRLFILYTIVVFILVFVPLGLAFLFPNVINPYFVAATIFLERVHMFIRKSLWPSKEELSV